MTEQLVASGKCQVGDQERMQHLRADLAKLVHWAMHDRGNPDIVARIHDCYRRCAVDLDDPSVMRLVRGTVKGELRKAGIDVAVPGLDPALDPPTIILTTKRTIQRLGGTSLSPADPGPALARKTSSAEGDASPRRPTTRRRAAMSASSAPREVTPSEIRAAFDTMVRRARERLQREGHDIAVADYLAAIYNDPTRKARLTAQVAEAVPGVDPKTLALTLDGFFRSSFKGSYIERTDRLGNRRAHKR